MGQLKTREVQAQHLKTGDIMVSFISGALSTIAVARPRTGSSQFYSVTLYHVGGTGLPVKVTYRKNSPRIILA